MYSESSLWMLLVLAVVVLAVLGAATLHSKRKRKPKSLYSEQVLRTLYERAQCAAAAWVDDIPEDKYLGVNRAQFFVAKGIVRVCLRTAYIPTVDVFFYLIKGEWHRGEIFYKGVQIR